MIRSSSILDEKGRPSFNLLPELRQREHGSQSRQCAMASNFAEVAFGFAHTTRGQPKWAVRPSGSEKPNWF
jgi:hypothetical protein